MTRKEIDTDIIKIAKELGAKRVIIENGKISIEFEEVTQGVPIQLPESLQTKPFPSNPKPIQPGQVVMYGCPMPGDADPWR